MGETTPPAYKPGVPTDPNFGGISSDETMPRRNERIEDYRKRIRDALIWFMSRCPAAVRVGLDEFMPCIAWGKDNAMPPVPRKANRHPMEFARCAASFKADLAEFHVADVVQALHAAINYISHPVLWDVAITGLGRRVRALEGFARTGLDGCRVDGSVSTGYRLVDHPKGVTTRDHAPIFGNASISNEPRDNERGEQPQ